MIRLLLVNALVALAGLGALPLVGIARTRGELVRRAGAAPLVGLALVGLVAATAALLHVPVGMAGVGVLGAVFLAAGLYRLERGAATRPQRQLLDRVAAVAGLTTLTVLLGHALLAFSAKPLSEYDGWAIWALKAKALAEFGWADRSVFASGAYQHAHLEYPLLLPALEALGIRAAGGLDARLVVFQFLLVGVAGIAALWSLLEDHVRPALLWPCLVALAAAPTVLGDLATAYADLPVALFVAAAVAAAGRWLIAPAPGFLAVATLLFAAAVNTKNEGLAYAAAAYAALLVADRQRWRRVLLSGAFVAASLVPWRLFVAAHGLHGADYRLSDSFDPGWVLGRVGRGPIALERLGDLAFSVGRWALLGPLVVVAIAAAFALGARRLAAFAASFLALSLLVLTWIYLISPLGIGDYLDFTADRVVSGAVVAGAALVPLLAAEVARVDLRG